MRSRQVLLRRSIGLAVILVLGMGCNHSETHETGLGQAAEAIEQGVIRQVRVGEEFDPNPLQYGPPVTSSVRPSSVAFDGKNYVVAWEYDGNNQFFTQVGRYSPELGRLDDVPLNIYESGYAPPFGVEVASDGNGSVLAYQLCESAGQVKCHYRIKRLDADGKPIDATGINLTSGETSTKNLRIVGSKHGYLAVWTEQNVLSYTEPYHVRGAIIDAHAANPIGQPFDIADTLASTAACYVRLAVAASDSNYLVVWTKPAGVGFQSGYDFASARVAFDGVVMSAVEGAGSSELKIGGASNYGIDLGSDGKDFLLAFTDFAVGANAVAYETVFGAKITEQGGFASDTAVMLGDTAHDHGTPTVAFTRGNYLVAFHQRSRSDNTFQTRVSFVNPDGTANAASSMRLLSDNGIGFLLPAQCGPSCYGVWARDYSGQTAIAAASVASSLPIDESNSTLVSVAPRDEGGLGVACAKSGCVEIFDAGYSRWSAGARQILLNELDGKGQVISSAPTALTEYHGPGTYYAAVASDGEGYLVSWWERFDNVTSRMHVVALDGRGRVISGTEKIVKAGSTWPGSLKLASTGDGYLLVYRDDISGKGITTGLTLDKLGNVISSNTFTVDRGYNNAVMPTALAASKHQYLLVVREDLGYLTIRLDKSGKLLEHEVGNTGAFDPVLGASRLEPKSITSNGSEFLLVWSDPTATGGAGKARGTTRITEEGKRTELSGELSPPLSLGALAWDGNAYLWLWSEQIEQGITPYTQHVTEFNVSGDNAIVKRDTTIQRAQCVDGIGKFATSHAGVIWTYGYRMGEPEARFNGPSRIRHRFISGLCFGDPKGDSNDNGICDSGESFNLPETGVGGSANTSSELAAGGSSSTVGQAGTATAQGGVESSTSASTSAGSSVITTTGNTTAAEGGRGGVGGTSAAGGMSTSSKSRQGSAPKSHSSGEPRDSDGCSCSTAGARSPSQPWIGAMGIALLVGRNLRRRAKGPFARRTNPKKAASTLSPRGA